MSGMGDMIVILPVMMVANQIDFNDPTNLMLVRGAFATVQILLLSLSYFVYRSIQKENNTTKIKVPPSPTMGQDAPWETQTIKEYDMSKLQQYLQEMAVQMVIISFIHFQWNFVPPLFLQTVMNPVRFYKTKVIQVHFFGMTGPEYTRPFPEDPNPLASLLGGGQPEQPPEQSGQGLPPAGTIEEIAEEAGADGKEKKGKEKKDNEKKDSEKKDNEKKEKEGKKNEKNGKKEKNEKSGKDDKKDKNEKKSEKESKRTNVEVKNDDVSEDLLLVD